MELEKVKEIIAQVLGMDPDEISEETSFRQDLCADSLDLYQIVMLAEKEFEIEIDAAQAEGINTVEDACQMIRRLTRQGGVL